MDKKGRQMKSKRFSPLKLITILVLITFPLWGTACKGDGSEGPEVELDQIEETENPQAAPLQDPAVLEGSGPEVLSSFPPEVDKDQDGVLNVKVDRFPDFPLDNCPEFFNPEQEDSDGDGIGDACE